MPEPTVRSEHPLALRVVVGTLALGALWVFLPLWPYIVLAVWFASFARPLHERLARGLRGRRWAAGGLTLLLFLVILGPLVFITIALTVDAIELGRSILSARSGHGALTAIVSTRADGAAPASLVSLPSFDLPSMWRFAQEHGQRVYAVFSGVAGFAATAVLGFFVFIASAYASLVDGPRAYAWAEAHMPLARRHQERLAAAFLETGRGLTIGVGLTGLSQGLLATIGYLALGVPRALVLGIVTTFASVFPSVGTALVWVPVSIGLALDGQTTKAIILAAVGVVVVSSVDNVLHPLFSRWGKLDLHAFVVLLAMLGGIVAFGGWGLLLGPLVVRLAVEGLRIFREERLAERLLRRSDEDQPQASSATSSPTSSPPSSV